MADKKRRDYGLTPEEFINTWQEVNSPDEVVAKLSQLSRERGKLNADETIKKSIILARAAVYRSKGIQLKKMEKRNPRKLNVTKLNEQITHSAATPEVPVTA